ncbi:serine hydrolase domain-containing protein [Streptomyces sp. NPDC049577]|uniref:serine hydrolase domain-containing protein n=1 Tax=Streptomyces sp. NPDC049577 TaxID=3155153 RepID=UPI003449FF27
MRTRRRTTKILMGTAVAALCFSVAMPALAAEQRVPAALRASQERTPPNADALRRALAGLPDDGATAAQVRYSGPDGKWQGASGAADVQSGRAAKGDERFRAGSITKTFTAAVVLQLVHEGKLDLDGTVQRYLPGLLPAGYPEVRVKQLLDYTSGLPSGDTRGTPGEADWERGRYTTWGHRELVRAGFDQPMEFAPGTRQHYGNIGYNVLGLLIEKATGHTYERELRDRVLRPAGLKDTYSPGDERGIRGRRTHGYQSVPDGRGGTRLVDTTEWDQSETWASGDLITTTADLERFTEALFAGRIVPQKELQLMFTVPEVPAYDPEEGKPADGKPAKKPVKASYSSGLRRMKLGDTEIWGKSGSRYGYLNGFGASRDATGRVSRILVYSVNSTNAKMEDVTPDSRAGRIVAAGFPVPS